MLRVYRAVRGAQVRRRLRRLRGSARAGDPDLLGGRRRARPRPRALPRVHRRRVPGRQPPPADAARAVARPARRALRRRRRLPVDLRLHGCVARPSARDAAAVPARGGHPARGELPLVAAGARAREPPGAEARRRREDVARDACGRARARAARVRGRGRFAVERIRDARRSVRGRRDPLPHERAPGRLRGGAARGGHPCAGRVVPRPRERALRAAAARVAGRRAQARGGARLGREPARQARRARDGPPERPRTARRGWRRSSPTSTAPASSRSSSAASATAASRAAASTS